MWVVGVGCWLLFVACRLTLVGCCLCRARQEEFRLHFGASAPVHQKSYNEKIGGTIRMQQNAGFSSVFESTAAVQAPKENVLKQNAETAPISSIFG